jgi:hypothetical protein
MLMDSSERGLAVGAWLAHPVDESMHPEGALIFTYTILFFSVFPPSNSAAPARVFLCM